MVIMRKEEKKATFPVCITAFEIDLFTKQGK